MISKAQIKLVRSLEQKKFRTEHGLFIAEGSKLVSDMSRAFCCRQLFAVDETAADFISDKALIQTITRQELNQISLLRNPQDMLALFQIVNRDIDDLNLDDSRLVLALDDIQDPGNLGTIIRTADWFGIRNIVCSEHTADVYNPKVVQATMGALARVSVFYTDLPVWLDKIKNVPIYGTLLDGRNIYQTELSSGGVIVMGNEGNGLSDEVRRCVSSRLFIPSYPPDVETSESLNVAIATALVCSEFRRRMVQNPKAGV